MGVDARPRKSNVSNLVQKTAFKSSLCHLLIANSPVIEPTVEESFRLAPKNLTMLSCRAGHSRFRHFLGDFGECRFGRLFLGFLFIHSFHDLCFESLFHWNRSLTVNYQGIWARFARAQSLAFIWRGRQK
jgi:hypothetical protein